MMRPPICVICDKKMKDIDDGGLIYFKMRLSDIEWNKIMKEKGMVGHPPYAEWFCSEHYDKAYELKDLTIDEAMKRLKT
jgi:hypothetical protein